MKQFVFQVFVFILATWLVKTIISDVHSLIETVLDAAANSASDDKPNET